MSSSTIFLSLCLLLGQVVQNAKCFSPVYSDHVKRDTTFTWTRSTRQTITKVERNILKPASARTSAHTRMHHQHKLYSTYNNNHETSTNHHGIDTDTDIETRTEKEVINNDVREEGIYQLSSHIGDDPSSRRKFMKHMLVSSAAAASLLALQGSEEASASTSVSVSASVVEESSEADNNQEGTSSSDLLISSSSSVAGGLDWRYFVAGGGCASFSHGVATPFDVIKTKMQAEPETYSSGLKDTAVTLVKNGGPGALLAGLTPTLIGFGAEGAVKFGVYESLKPLFISLLGGGIDDKFVPYLAASIGAGAVASLMLVPMERARIKVVTSSEENVGPLGGIGTLIQEEGLGSILFGYGTMLFKQVPYTMTKQVTFDIFATQIYAFAILSLVANEETRFLTTTLSAFLASILACTISQPGDVILTKRFKENSNDSIGGIISSIYEQKGIGGFFAGYSARLAHVAAIVTSQLVVYDYLKQLLGLPATGL